MVCAPCRGIGSPGRGPQYVDLVDLPPFRRLDGGGQTSGATLPMGRTSSAIGQCRRPPGRAHAVPSLPHLCMALFGFMDLRTEVVPIAYFSEVPLPSTAVCWSRTSTRSLADYPTSFRLVQRDLQSSDRPPSWRRVRQSRRRGKEAAGPSASLHANTAGCKRRPRHPALLPRLVLDVDRLARDMASPDVQADLDRTRALAGCFRLRRHAGPCDRTDRAERRNPLRAPSPNCRRRDFHGGPGMLNQ